MDFKDIFYYCETSPSGIRWKIDVYGGKNYSLKRVSAGDIAGSNKTVRGYWSVIHNRIAYRTSRIVWSIFNGEITNGLQVDHIDRDKSNNKISNLRLVTNAVNKRNSGKYKNNCTGTTGVRTVVMGGVLYYSATWADTNHKRHAAYFNTNKYGIKEAFQMACEKRKLELRNLNCEGAGYSDSHGK